MTPGDAMGKRWRTHLTVLAAYAALAAVLTLPLALHFSTHVTGDGIDDPALAWNLWWAKFALVDRHLSDPFLCRWMFYPIGINLAFYTLTLLNGAIAIPLWTTLGGVPTVNVSMLLSFVLAGYGTFLLTLTLLPRKAASTRWGRLSAFLAGIFYAFAAPKLFYAALGQFNIASSQWIPFTVLYLERLRRGWRWRDALLAALFLTLQAWAEMSFAAFLILWIALWAAWEIVEALLARRWDDLWKLASRLALVGAFFAVGISPVLARMLPDMRTYGDFMAPGGGFADVFSTDLLGFFLPTMHHPLLGGLVGRMHFPHDKGQQLYLGYTLLALALWGAWRGRKRRRVAFMTLAAAVFFLLTLGPSVRFDRHDLGVPGPFLLLAHVPLLKGNRYPSRYSVLLFLALSQMAAYALATWRPRRQTLAAGAIAALFLAEHLSVPLPLSDLRVPRAYDAIASDGGAGAVLEIPLGWRNGFDVFGKQDVAIMYAQWYQTAHQHPIVGGNTSRNPEIKFRYFLETPFFRSIAALESGHRLPADAGKRDAEVARRLACDLNIRYVAIHPAKVRQETADYVRQALPLHLLASDDTTLVYRIDLPCGEKDRPPAEWMLAEGWHDGTFRLHGVRGTAWAWGDNATFLHRGGAKAISLELQSPGAQTVELLADGRSLGRKNVAAGDGVYTWALPDSWDSGLHVMTLRASGRWPLGTVARGPWNVGGVKLTVPILARSASEDFGDFAHIYVNGTDYSPDVRGYNLVAVEPASGKVLGAAAFDTFLDTANSAALARWVARWPRGTVVAGAVRDEASYHITPEAVAALRTLGVAQDITGHFRRAHAFVGVVGAEPGSVPEAWSDDGPVAVDVGGGWTHPWVRIGLKSVR